MYPDAYEVGLPNQGVQILYEILNERDGVLAERTYSVWPDMEAVMREHGIPQFTVDGHRPVRDFDLFGLSFSTELGYTNMLTALDLAGIPLHAVDRTDDDPIVLAGGHAAFNPEPIADFVDAVVLGDGEEIVLAITEVVREWKAEGRPGGRDERAAAARGQRRRLRAAVLRRGVRRPSGALVARDAQPARRTRPGAQAHPDGPRRLALPAQPAGAARRDGARAVQRRDLPRLHPRLPVLPGRDDHPPGARALDPTIGDMVENGIRKSGFEEVGLLSLSSADHSEIGEVAKGLADRYEGTNVSLSLPSTRVDAFNITLANEFSRNGRRSGLTFAPEGGRSGCAR